MLGIGEEERRRGEPLFHLVRVVVCSVEATPNLKRNLTVRLSSLPPLPPPSSPSSQVCSRLFGIELKEVPFVEGEAWTPGGASLQKLVLWHEEEGALGHFYLDLFPRPGKFSHAAHFTIRCGRLLDDGEYQLPIVSLVCNFSRSDDELSEFSGGESSVNSPHVMISHAEVETLFHEFGHALHSMLSRTEFQHLSGTRGKLDFVEVRPGSENRAEKGSGRGGESGRGKTR